MPVTADDVRQAIADTLHKDVTALAASWTGTATRALGKARMQLYGTLGAQGYAKGQIDAWVDADEWVKAQALYHALSSGDVVNGEEEGKDFEHLNQLGELAGLQMFDAAGDFILPEGRLTGLFGHGRSKAESSFVDPATGKFKPW